MPGWLTIRPRQLEVEQALFLIVLKETSGRTRQTLPRLFLAMPLGKDFRRSIRRLLLAHLGSPIAPLSARCNATLCQSCLRDRCFRFLDADHPSCDFCSLGAPRKIFCYSLLGAPRRVVCYFLLGALRRVFCYPLLGAHYKAGSSCFCLQGLFAEGVKKGKHFFFLLFALRSSRIGAANQRHVFHVRKAMTKMAAQLLQRLPLRAPRGTNTFFSSSFLHYDRVITINTKLHKMTSVALLFWCSFEAELQARFHTSALQSR